MKRFGRGGAPAGGATDVSTIARLKKNARLMHCEHARDGGEGSSISGGKGNWPHVKYILAGTVIMDVYAIRYRALTAHAASRTTRPLAPSAQMPEVLHDDA